MINEEINNYTKESQKDVAQEIEHNINLRPIMLSEYIGQETIVETLKIAIEAALQRKEPLEHILFNGPPGLGKTTLSHIIANEMNAKIITSSGPALEKGGDLMGLLTHLEYGDVFFIDEIHRIPKVVEEFLYPAMEDFAVDFIFDKGVHARTHRYKLENFTLIGATTRAGLLSSPLRERFGITRDLDFYNENDLVSIIKRSASILKVTIDEDGAYETAKRSRGTPRIANRLLKRVRDHAMAYGDGNIDLDIAEKALAKMDIDPLGLDIIDKKILDTIINKFNGGPVGVGTIAISIGEEVNTIEDVYEPYLLQIGFIKRTSKGRVATERSFKHLGIKNPLENKTLF